MCSAAELSDFLADVEKRAFKQADFAVRDRDTALDIVQDAMLRLAEKYGDRPASELPMLFQRILQNLIRDYYRRHKVRSLWTTVLSAFSSPDDNETDALDFLPADPTKEGLGAPFAQLERNQILAVIESEVAKLPPRQREAFLMRYWEEMNTTETALIMGCSEGSVKTHCSRATHALATALKMKGITL